MELAKKKHDLACAKKDLEGIESKDLMGNRKEVWMKKEAKVRTAIQNHLGASTSRAGPSRPTCQGDASCVIQSYINQKKYDDAFRLLRGSIDKVVDWTNIR